MQETLGGRTGHHPSDPSALARADHEQSGSELLGGLVQGARRARTGERAAVGVDALFPQLVGEAIQGLAPTLIELLLDDLRTRATESRRAAVHRRDDQAERP